jgi:hypothetical protein
MTQRRNTEFQYLYRDASNYKSHGSIVLRGACDDPLLLPRMKKALDAGTYFIPAQIDIPPIDFETTGEFPANDDDHPWHEFDAWEATDDEATDPRSPAEFVAAVERAGREGWDSGSYP